MILSHALMMDSVRAMTQIATHRQAIVQRGPRVKLHARKCQVTYQKRSPACPVSLASPKILKWCVMMVQRKRLVCAKFKVALQNAQTGVIQQQTSLMWRVPSTCWEPWKKRLVIWRRLFLFDRTAELRLIDLMTRPIVNICSLSPILNEISRLKQSSSQVIKT